MTALRCLGCGDLLRHPNALVFTCSRTPCCRALRARLKRLVAGLGSPPPPDCSICGRRLRSDNRTGVCSRTPDCKNAGRAAPYEYRPPAPPAPCSICGQPVRSDNRTGICQRTPACTAAYMVVIRDRSAVACSGCGQPMKPGSKTGICRRPECHAAYEAACRALLQERLSACPPST